MAKQYFMFKTQLNFYSKFFGGATDNSLILINIMKSKSLLKKIFYVKNTI